MLATGTSFSGSRTVDDFYRFVDLIGAGPFGTVKLAEHKETGGLYAVKIIEIPQGSPSLANARREVQILSSFTHPNLVRFKQVFETPRSLFYISERVDGSELLAAAVERGSFSAADAVEVVRAVLSALAALHETRIHHLNVKPENLLLPRNASGYGDVLLSDSGLSVVLEPSKYKGTLCCAPHFVAPEVLDNSVADGAAADMWSVGMLAYLLISGQYPFPFEGGMEPLYAHILEGQRAPLPEDAEAGTLGSFVSRTVVPQPGMRLTASDAMSHPWFLDSHSTSTDPSLLERLRAFNAEMKRQKAALAVLATEDLISELAAQAATPFVPAAVPGDDAPFRSVR